MLEVFDVLNQVDLLFINPLNYGHMSSLQIVQIDTHIGSSHYGETCRHSCEIALSPMLMEATRANFIKTEQLLIIKCLAVDKFGS